MHDVHNYASFKCLSLQIFNYPNINNVLKNIVYSSSLRLVAKSNNLLSPNLAI